MILLALYLLCLVSSLLAIFSSSPVFNADISHQIKSIFQASHKHSSKSSFINFSFRLPSFQGRVVFILPTFFFLRYAYTVHHKPMICKVLSIAISDRSAFCFPHDWYCCAVNDLPLLQLLIALLPLIELVCLGPRWFPNFFRRCSQA